MSDYKQRACGGELLSPVEQHLWFVCSVESHSHGAPATIRPEDNASWVFLAWTWINWVIGFRKLVCLFGVYSKEYQGVDSNISGGNKQTQNNKQQPKPKPNKQNGSILVSAYSVLDQNNPEKIPLRFEILSPRRRIPSVLGFRLHNSPTQLLSVSHEAHNLNFRKLASWIAVTLCGTVDPKPAARTKGFRWVEKLATVS